MAPNFSGEDETGRIINLSNFKGKKKFLLIFFRGYWWPHCRRQLAELSKIKLPEDTELWAVSVESSEASAEFKKRNTEKGYPISFPLLWDKDYKIIDAFGLTDPRYKGHKYEGIPYATTHIIDKTGKIRFSHVALTYTIRPSNEKILSILSSLNN